MILHKDSVGVTAIQVVRWPFL